jgi:site-specific recombinase XerD
LAHWLPIRDPQWVNPELQSTHAQLIDSYDPYMTAVVGLTPSTRIYRRRYAAEFLDWILVQEIALSQLSDLQLSHYIVAKCDVNGVTNKTNQRSISIKSFINFLVSEGESTVAWTSFISRPKVPYNIATTQPLTDGELSHLLKAFDRTQPAGKRDYAMARCLIDLGVRTSDVAGFNLDHIDWR